MCVRLVLGCPFYFYVCVWCWVVRFIFMYPSGVGCLCCLSLLFKRSDVCVLVVTVFAVYICHYVFHDHGSLFLFVDASRNYFAYFFGEW